MKTSLLSRVDVKVTMPARLLPDLLDHLTQAGDQAYRLVYTPAGPAPLYSTVYFDTPDLADYHDHHRGRRVRKKVRYRRYDSTDSTFFEVKRRRTGRLCEKSRIAVANVPWELGAEERRFAGDLGIATGRLQPTLNVVYRRLTLLGQDERVTIDLGLHFEAVNLNQVSLSHIAIIEIKQPTRDKHTPIHGALRHYRLRPHSISKYCIGSACCTEALKRNRFRPKLRRLGVS